MISFRPNYSSNAKTQNSPPVEEKKEDSSLNHYIKTEKTDEDRSKLLTTRISRMEKAFEFFNLLERSNSLENSKFNSQHWTCWFQEFSKKIKHLKHKEKEQIHKIVHQFQNCLQNKEIAPLQPVQTAVIVTALNELKVANPILVDTLYQNAITHINEYTVKEFVMLLNGGRTLFSKQQLAFLLGLIEKKLLVAKLEDLNVLTPHAIASILKACSQAEKYGKLPETLTRLAENNFHAFTFIESIDLIAGLRLCSYSNKGIYFLEKIESRIAQELGKENKCSASAVIAMKHFSSINYMPLKLLPLISKYLSDNHTHIWDKMSLFQSLAMLGYHEIRPQFEEFLNSLTTICAKKLKLIWQTIYTSDLYDVFYAAACFCSPNKPLPPVLKEIAELLVDKLEELDYHQRLGFGEILCALKLTNDHKQFLPLKMPEPDSKETDYQASIMNQVSKWIEEQKNLSFLEVLPEYDIGGRSIDFVIKSKNNDIPPIACEVDSKYHFCCNDQRRPLGKNLIRNHMLRHLGFILCIIKKRPKNQVASINPITNALQKLQK